MKVKQHYETLLENIYSWMVGDFTRKMKEQKQFFVENGIEPKSTKVAIDLGAGHGLQSIGLAECGYRVTAVDLSKELLKELNHQKRDLDVTTIEDDMLNFLSTFNHQAELIVCMGDSLTHLESVVKVDELLREAALHLESEGKIILSFRDLTTELTGEERFLAVKSDASRILTCFLEYYPDRVIVHDILHENKGGTWMQKVSSYPKLRLNERMILHLFEKHQLVLVKSSVINRMVYLIGERTN